MDKITVLFILIAGMFVMMSFAGIADVKEESRIFIGWSCKDITPDKPVSLYGQYYKRISTYVESPLKVTALALETRAEDGNKEQAIMVSCDVINIRRELQDLVKQKVKPKIPDFDVNKLFLNANALGWYNQAFESPTQHNYVYSQIRLEKIGFIKP